MPFTPVQTLLGGYLLHLSSSSLLTETGRVFGISGIVDNALLGDGAVWRWSTIAGLVAGPVVSGLLGDVGVDNGLAMWEGLSWSRIGLAGILVGLGSRVSLRLDLTSLPLFFHSRHSYADDDSSARDVPADTSFAVYHVYHPGPSSPLRPSSRPP